MNKPQATHVPQTAAAGDVYEIITNCIIEALANGVIPWKQPWQAFGQARNYASGQVYRGINALLLSLTPVAAPFFLTYRQAQALGGQVRKGEKGRPIIFFSVAEREGEDGRKDRLPFAKRTHVFNIDQIEGVEWKLPVEEPRTHTPVEAADLLAANYAQRGGPRVLHGASEAYYAPLSDRVAMPSLAQFTHLAGYYATLFHELGHSTGHARRLNRASLTQSAAFGSEDYAKEELVAELCAAFLSARAGLDLSNTVTDSAAYVQTWLQALRNDKKLVVSAASQAQKAAQYILGEAEPVETESAM